MRSDKYCSFPHTSCAELRIAAKISPEQFWREEKNWGRKEVVSLCCACLDQDLMLFAHLWRCCSLGEVMRTKLIQLYQEEHPAAWEIHWEPSYSEWSDCSVVAQSPCALTAGPQLWSQLVTDGECFLLGCKLVLSTGCRYKLQEGGVEDSWPSKGWFGQPLRYLPSHWRFLKSRCDG